MRWTSWRRAISRTPGRSAPPRDSRARAVAIDDARAALVRRGVPEAFVAPLARRVVQHGSHEAPERLEAMLDGIAMALDLQKSTQEQLSQSIRGLREVERMMGAFSGELSKLDEVLGVLAAYVRRMRTSGGGAPDRTLH